MMVLLTLIQVLLCVVHSAVQEDAVTFHQPYVGRGLVELNEEKKNRTRERLLFFCHFHKAGGTSMISFFQDVGLASIHGVGAQNRYPLTLLPGPRQKHPALRNKASFMETSPHASMGALGIWSSDQLLFRSIVNGSVIDSSPAGNASFYAALYEAGVDMVVSEYNFLQPQDFNRMQAAVDMVAMVREPWGRFHSTFEKEVDQMCVGSKHRHKRPLQPKAEKCLRTNTLASWILMEGGIPKHSKRNLQFPGMLAPNYYTRMLNGLLDQPLLDLNESHLEAAKHVIKQFDLLLYLEMDPSTRDASLAAFFPESLATGIRLGSKSNNYLKQVSCYQDIKIASEKIRPYFESLNGLDIELYKYITSLVDNRTSKMAL